MNLQQFFLILLARWRLIFGTLVLAVGTTVLVSVLLPKKYTATATVLVDIKSPDPVMGMYSPALGSPAYMATQVDIVNSDRVAQRVVRALGFGKSADLVEKWREKTGGKGSVESYYANLLQLGLDVKPSQLTNVITIKFKGEDPRFAAAVANGFAQAYIDTNIDLKVEPAKQYATWFNERTRQLRDDLEKAQTKLSAFQQEKGIVSIDERLDVENARLNELSSQLTAIEAQKSEARSRQSQAASQIETAPDVINHPIVQGLRADLARLEAKMQETAGQLGKNHPQYQRQEAEIASLRQRLGEEMKKIASSLGNTTQVNTQRESEIRTALAAQKKKVLDLKEQRDEVSVLVRDVDSAQKAYDLVSNRLSQTSLESQSQQTNVAILTPAEEPLEPSSPKILLNTLLSVVLGGMLGIGTALVLELTNRRIRSADDLAESLGLPVLAVLTPGRPLHGKGIKGFFRRLRPVAGA